jgi:hypothetical protein
MKSDRARRPVIFAVLNLFLVASAVWGLFALANHYFDSRSQTLRPKVITDPTSARAAREVTRSNTGTHADKTLQWLTPMGSLYFGDHPPPGSTLVEPTENPAETHKDISRDSKHSEEKTSPSDRVPDRDSDHR